MYLGIISLTLILETQGKKTLNLTQGMKENHFLKQFIYETPRKHWMLPWEMANDLFQITIENLNKNNFQVWKFLIMNFLMGKGY
jgi:hypothetical protein